MFAPKYILQIIFGIMSLLACVLRQWTPCPPQIRDQIVQCVFGLTLQLIPTPHRYRAEACGSGALLGYFTKLELSEWLKTHQLFLGHGGSQITDIAQVSLTFQGPIVVVKNVFRDELYKTWQGHTSGVMSVVWSPDGQTFASGSFNKPFKLWSNNGKLIKTLEELTFSVNCAAWSPDGSTYASGSCDRTIKLWSKDGKILNRLEGHTDWVSCVAWSPDGQTLASASNDCTIKLWNKNSECIKTLKKCRVVANCVAWSPDGSTLACGFVDGTIELRK